MRYAKHGDCHHQLESEPIHPVSFAELETLFLAQVDREIYKFLRQSI